MISRIILFFGCLMLCLLLCFDVGNSDCLECQHSCRNGTMYDTNSTSGRAYRNNLDSLLSALTSNASSQPNGFYNYTVGSVNDTAVYGLFLCRGDVKTSDCQACLTTARSQVLQLCPNDKWAVIWYDNCMLRYSNQSIFSRLDTSIAGYLYTYPNVTDLALFNQVLGDTMDQIATKAANDPSGKKFAVQEADLSTLERRIYALGQCTPDLSSLDCERCIKTAVSFSGYML